MNFMRGSQVAEIVAVACACEAKPISYNCLDVEELCHANIFRDYERFAVMDHLFAL